MGLDALLLERIQKWGDAALVALVDKYKPLLMSIVCGEVPVAVLSLSW